MSNTCHFSTVQGNALLQRGHLKASKTRAQTKV